MSDTENTVNELMQNYQNLFTDTMRKQIEQRTKDISQEVYRRLEHSAKEIVSKFMGMDLKWGSGSNSHIWEIDHCNGRAGNTLVGQYFVNRVQKVVENWLDTHVLEMFSVPDIFSAQQTQAMMSEYKRTFEHCVKKALLEKAEKDAKLYVEQLLKQSDTEIHRGR